MNRMMYEAIRLMSEKDWDKYLTDTALIDFAFKVWGYELVERKYLRYAYDEKGIVVGVTMKVPRCQITGDLSTFRDNCGILPYDDLRKRPESRNEHVSKEISDIVELMMN